MELSRRFWFRIASYSLLLIIIVRMRPPSAWAKTQLLFNYDFGFQRRALTGQIVSFFKPDGVTHGAMHWLTAGMTLTAVACLLLFVVRNLMKSDAGVPVAAGFMTSVGLATFIGNTGNLDAGLLMCALLCLLLPANGLLFLLLRVAICGIGVLIHENMLPYFTPLIA